MSQPMVRTQNGTLRGTVGTNIDGDNFLKFTGIPYGKPPVDELRFKPPQAVDPWKGIWDATNVGSGSISKNDITQEVVGSEDCLYLNVYTKQLPRSQSNLKPVMVFIHGGGLTFGSSSPSEYGPDFLMIKDIVYVSFNYRLGILGFLASDDLSLEVTGNMGLKDQRLALQWVQKNIASFNGDPKNVTLFGESAGSASVHAHVLSSGSKGLFHKAILQSGCALNSWLWGSKNNAREIVKAMGKSADSEKDAIEILKRIPALEIFSAQEKLGDLFYPANRRKFAAVVETPNDSAVFSKSVLEIIKEGSYNKVPTILGYTDNEGLLLNTLKFWDNELDVAINLTMEDFIPYELNVPKGSNDSIKISQVLNKLYPKSNQNQYDEFTDSYFLVGIIETIRNQLKTSKEPIYLYRMSLVGNRNFLKIVTNTLDLPGTAHADDLGYLFSSDVIPNSKPGSLDDKSVRTFVELWTNFAEFGNPTPNDKLNVLWKPIETVENIKLLDIGKTLVFKNIPERNRLEGWWDILKQWPQIKF